MNLSRIFAIMGRVILQFRHDHRTLGLLFVAPILVMSLLGYVFRQQENSVVAVVVVNQDNPPAGQASLSGKVIDTLKTNNQLTISEMSRQDAENAVRDGTQQVALVFPADFTSQILSAHKSSVQAIVEGSNPGQTGQALAVLGQSIIQSSSVVVQSLVPAQIAGLLPKGSPVDVTTVQLYGKSNLKQLDYFAPMFICYIAFFLIFLLTSVSFLRERTQGTMERISASPVTRLELVLGYMLGFGFFAVLQAAILVLFTVFVLNIQYSGSLLAVLVVTLVMAVGAVNLGILLSAFARNELQAIQFIPIVILPQVFLSGLLLPIADMPPWLQFIAKLMPLTYAINAMTSIMVRGETLAGVWTDLAVLIAFAAVIAVLAAGSVRREVA